MEEASMLLSLENNCQPIEHPYQNHIGELHPLSDAQKLIFNNVVSYSTILRMAKNREFPAFKLRGGKWYFVLEVAQEWLMQQYTEYSSPKRLQVMVN